MVPQLLQPSCDVLVGLVFADIVDKQSSDRTSIVGRCDGSISLLPSGIPNLGFNRLCVYLDGPGRKFYTDGGLGIEVEFVTRESTQQVGFTNARVSDQDDCEERCQYTGAV